MRLRVAWWHYNKPASARAGKVQLTVHHAGTCHVVDGVDCRRPCRSAARTRQPRCVMKTLCRTVTIKDGIAVIE